MNAENLGDKDQCIIAELSLDQVNFLLSRSMAIHEIFELYSHGKTYPEMFESLKSSKISESFKTNHYNKPSETVSFKVTALNKKLAKDRARQLEIYKQTFEDHPEIVSKVNLKTPTWEIFYIEQYNNDDTITRDEKVFEYVYFGAKIGEAQRKLRAKYDLRQRDFLGNTSMEPEVCVFQANLAKISSGDLVYDPFCGSGSNLIAAAHFGAFTIGSDLDYNIIHSRGKSSKMGMGWRNQKTSLKTQMVKYGLTTHLGTFRTDFSQTGFYQKEESINAIVCDPPYGVREPTKKVGKKDETESWHEKIAKVVENEEYQGDLTNVDIMDLRMHYPQKVEYRMEDLFKDLVKFGARNLKIGGRLTFWLPVDLRDLTGHSITHPDMTVIARCIDPFGDKTGRELWVLEKVKHFSGENAVFESRFYKDQTNNFRELHLGPNGMGTQKVAKMDGTQGLIR